MKIGITILFLSILNSCFSQPKEEIMFLYNINESLPQQKKYKFAYESENEIAFIFSNLFLFYKKYMSSQDISSCSFTPSCSVYALKAIKKQGLIIGVINFFDRFTRCNSLSPDDYKQDRKQKLLIDILRDSNYEPL